MNLEDFSPEKSIDIDSLEDLDRWIVLRSMDVSEKMRKDLDAFEFGHAIIEFEKFFWKDFCDNYLEIIRDKINNPANYEDGERKKLSAQS